VERSSPKQARKTPPPVEMEEPVTPPHAEPPVGRSGSSGMLNRRHGSRIGGIMKKGKEKFKAKEPTLVLNALDFAGQKEYRPMHHCFITRRALYVVVFKIPDLLSDDQAKSCEAIEEIRYWIQSIHAHIYPPDPGMKDEDEKVKRVFLVGTHRGEEKLSQEDLDKINDLIEEKLLFDDRCVNHVCSIKLPSYKSKSFFIPVENSLDKTSNGASYLKKSGTKPLQEKIKAVSDKELPFLHELHPIKWLRFEEDLKDLSKVKKIVTVEEVDVIAANCDIRKEDEKDLALRFFHDTGKIIYPGEFVLNLWSQSKNSTSYLPR
jgi:hypothetical protein